MLEIAGSCDGELSVKGSFSVIGGELMQVWFCFVFLFQQVARWIRAWWSGVWDLRWEPIALWATKMQWCVFSFHLLVTWWLQALETKQSVYGFLVCKYLFPSVSPCVLTMDWNLPLAFWQQFSSYGTRICLKEGRTILCGSSDRGEVIWSWNGIGNKTKILCKA